MTDLEQGARLAREELLSLYAKHKAQALPDETGRKVKGWRAVAIFLDELSGPFWRMAARGERAMSPDQVNLVLTKCGHNPMAPDPVEEIRRLGILRVIETIDRRFPEYKANTAIAVHVPVGEDVGAVNVKTSKTAVSEIACSSVTSSYKAAKAVSSDLRSFLSLVGLHAPPEPKTKRQRWAVERIRGALSGGQDMRPACFSVEEWSALTIGPESLEPGLDPETRAWRETARREVNLITVGQLKAQARDWGKLRKRMSRIPT